MANMSYCRFENTATDLSDCVDTMRDMGMDDDGLWNESTEEGETVLNEYEQAAVKRMAKLCEKFLEMYADRC